MIDLKGTPLLGFQTNHCNDSKYCTQVYKETFPSLSQNDCEKAAYKQWKGCNVRNVIGYVPIVGVVIGISRLVTLVAPHTPKVVTNKTGWVARGIIESLSLGSVFIVPDIVATISRKKLI